MVTGMVPRCFDLSGFVGHSKKLDERQTTNGSRKTCTSSSILPLLVLHQLLSRKVVFRESRYFDVNA